MKQEELSSVSNDQVQIYSSGTLVKQGTVLTGEEIISGTNNSMFVYSGGTANSTTVNSSGYVYVSNGGTANDTIVNSSGKVYVSNGGIANSTVINSSGKVYVDGTTNNASNLGGYMYIHSGGVADNTVVETGIVWIYSGGFASNISLTSGGRIDVCGRADDMTLTYGSVDIYSGGSANNVDANGDVRVYVSSGAVSNITLQGKWLGSGYRPTQLFVRNAGFADKVTLNKWAWGHVENGGTTSDVTVNTNACIWVSGGGYARDVDVNSGGKIYVDGEEYAATADDYPEALHGSAKDVTVYDQGSAIISGGEVTNLLVSSGGFAQVSGVADVTTVDVVGSIHNGEIKSGGNLTIANGTQLWGATVLGGTVTVSGWADVYGELNFNLSERTVNDTFIVDDITNLNVSGTSFYSITVADNQAHGTYQLAGNAANFNQTISIKDEVLTVNGNAVTVGNTQYSLAVTDSILTLTIGGTSTPEPTGDQVKVYSSGTLVKQGTVLTGEEIVAGSNNVMRIFDGGTANSTLINSSGYVHVSNGGVANDSLINGYNGNMCVYSGGFASNTSMTAYGGIDVYGSAEQTTLTDGIMTVFAGGIANNIYGSGHFNVYVSGTATNAELHGINRNGSIQFGHMIVRNSGFASNVTANAHGGLWVSSGGVAKTAVANKNGTVWIKGGGFVQDVDINAGGVLRVYGEEYAATKDDFPEALHGSAKDVTVYDQGSAIISGGEVTNLLVSSGGFAQVSGVADVTTVDVVGSIHNGEIKSGGNLTIANGTQLWNTTILGGTVTVTGWADVYGELNFNLSERTVNDTFIVDDITGLNVSGTSFYSITVADDQSHGTYQLAGNAANFNQTISIKGEVLTVNGNAVTVGDTRYSLAVTDSILTLTIGAAAPTSDEVQVFKDNTLIKQGTVLTGETIIGTNNNKMFVYEGGTAKDTLVDSNGFIYVSKGGLASNTTLRGAEYLEHENPGDGLYCTAPGSMGIFDGGIASNTHIYEGGVVFVQEGGTANKVMVYSHGNIFARGKNAVINNVTTTKDWCWVGADRGGTINNLVNIGGSVGIFDGGTLNNVVQNDDDYGRINVYSGGVVNNATINGAYISAEKNATLNNLTLRKPGMLILKANAVITGKHVYGGTVLVYDKVDASNADVTFNISERTTADKVIINDIANLEAKSFSITVSASQAEGEYKLAGNAAYFSGTLTIGDGTITYGSITVNGNDLVYNNVSYSLDQVNGILSLTIDNIICVDNGDEVQVFKDGTLVKQGTVLTGETIIGTNNNEMFVYEGGTAKDTLVENDGFIYVSKGGLASNTTLRGAEYVEYEDPGRGGYSPAPGSMGIFDGGIASNTHIYEGGRVFVYEGATANEVMVYSHGKIWARGKNAVINNVTTDKDWCWVGADKGGTINNLVNVGGSVGIFNGGTINNAILNESTESIHAGLSIYTGGVANNTTINGTYAWAEEGATLNNLTLREPGWISLQAGSILTGKHNYGGTVVVYGKVDASKADVTFNISERTTADRVIINDIANLEAKSFSITVSASQAEGEYKLAGNTANFTGTLTIGDDTITYGSITVNGNDLVYNNVSYSLDQVNGILSLTIDNIICVDNGDEVQVFKDGTLVKQGTVLTGETIIGTNNNEMFVYEGGTAKDTLVENDGFIYVSKGGLASNTTLRGAEYVEYEDPGRGGYSPAPGSMGIFDGGIASNTHIYEGGRVFVYEGATANEVMVYSHGKIWARGKNAVINNVTTDKDWCWVGADKGGTINNLVNVGGSVGIFNGGTINNAILNESTESIHAGLSIYTGGVANNTTVNGTSVWAEEGATLNNLTLRKLGIVILQADAILTGKHVYGGTVAVYGKVDASNADVTFDISERTTDDRVIIDDIANLEAKSFSITVSASQAEGVYRLAGNAANFSGTLTVGDGTITYGSLTVNGATLTCNDVNYTLVNSNSELALHVSGNVVDIIPPDAPIAIADITTPTNCNVTVTAIFAPDAVLNEYTINGSDWFVYNGSITFADNGSVSFRSADDAGNVSAITTYVVSNIDKIAPDAPVVTVDETEHPVEKVTVTASSEEGTIEYSFDGRNYQTYDDALVVTVNGEIFFRTVDDAGNVSEVTSVVIDNIDRFSDPVDSEYNFIKKSFSAKINGKTQNGIVLEFGKNAFSRLEDATGTIAILLDSKTTVSTIPANIEVIAGNADTPDDQYNFSSIPSRTVTISGINAGDVEFLRFATVNITDGAVVSHVIGGKESASETVKTSEKKGVVTETVTYTQNTAATGKVTVSDAAATLISGYSTVTLDNSTVENLRSTNVKNTENEKYIDNIISTVTRTETCSASGSVTLKNNSEAGSISGFDTVNITQSQTGDITLGESYTEKYSLKDGEESTTKTFSRTGSLTASDASIGDISGFATVKLTGTDAGDVELGIIEKITDDVYSIKATGTLTAKNSFAGTISGIAKVTLTDCKVMDIISSPDSTDKLSGSVTMTGSTAGNVENYSTLTLSGSIVSDVSNVNKVTAKSGFNTIANYTGTAGNDTLTINKNAVLSLGSVDMGEGTKDKFVNNGTLVLTCDFDRSFISGKGEIVAASGVYETLENKDKVLNLGATAEGFRTTKYENSDDSVKKAVKWDLKSGDYTGWLGSWQSGSDNVDFIKFTVSKNDVGKELAIAGADAVFVDKKGNALDTSFENLAAGTYTLKLEWDKSESTSYTLALA